MSLRNNEIILGKIKKGVVIRGTGIHGAKCVYLLQQAQIRILYFVNLNAGGSTFRGYPVYDVKTIPNSGNLIVIATSIDVYCSISKELRSNGMKEFYDFVYYEWLFKDVLLLHGNCHMEILKEYLVSTSGFTDKFSIYPYPLLVSSTKEFRTEPEIFENIDVWIHEDIRNNNTFRYEVSDEYIREHVCRDVLEIKIPHLYGISKMFFPQVINGNDGNNEALNEGNDTDGLFLSGDKIIETCISQNMGIDEILDYCMSDDALQEEEILDNFRKCMEKVRLRESSWDVKISQFIEMNYRNHKLFFDPGHPTNVIMEYIAKEVLKRLGVDELRIYCRKQMDDQEMCVYPCVIRTLGIKWKETEIRKTGKKLKDHMDFSEYIREYCWWRYYSIYKDQIN